MHFYPEILQVLCFCKSHPHTNIYVVGFRQACIDQCSLKHHKMVLMASYTQDTYFRSFQAMEAAKKLTCKKKYPRILHLVYDIQNFLLGSKTMLMDFIVLTFSSFYRADIAHYMKILQQKGPEELKLISILNNIYPDLLKS